MLILLSVDKILLPNYAAGIWLGQAYLWEALNHLSICQFLWDIICFLTFWMWNHFLLSNLLRFVVINLDKLSIGMVLISLQDSNTNVKEVGVKIKWANLYFRVFVVITCASSICSIFPLFIELNALEKSTNSVA